MAVCILIITGSGGKKAGVHLGNAHVTLCMTGPLMSTCHIWMLVGHCSKKKAAWFVENIHHIHNSGGHKNNSGSLWIFWPTR